MPNSAEPQLRSAALRSDSSTFQTVYAIHFLRAFLDGAASMKTVLNLPEQVRSLSRFPIPVAIATSLAVLLNLQVAHIIRMSDTLESQLIFACSAAVFGIFSNGPFTSAAVTV